MPRPSSSTLTEPSACSVTSMRLPWPAERLVGGVVDHFLDDVQRVVGARVHARPLLDRLEALQHADRRFVVVRGARSWAARFGFHGARDSRSPPSGPARSRAAARACYLAAEHSHEQRATLRSMFSHLRLFQAALRPPAVVATRTLADADGAPAQDEPLRAELFSADQMAQHGKRLAATHVLSDAALPDRLLGAPGLQRARAGRPRQAARRDRRRRAPLHAGGRMAARQLLPDRGRDPHRAAAPAARLQPRAAAARAEPVNGIGAGLPRVYDLALQAIAHGDGQVGRGTLSRFVAAYQIGAAAAARRAVGVPDHAAPGADREPAPRRRARRGRARRARHRRPLGRPACSTSRRSRRAT